MGTLKIEEGIASYLQAHAGLSALISTRVYINRIPQGATLPLVVFQRISTSRIITHDTSGLTDLASPKFQFDAWATTYASAKAITDQIRAALNGLITTVTIGADSVVIQAGIIDAERYNPELEEVGLERISSDYTVWHLE